MHFFFFRSGRTAATHFLAVGVGLAAVSLGAVSAQTPAYTILGLGNYGTDTLGHSSSTAIAVNNAGQVLGSSSVFDSSHTAKGSDAFLYSISPLQHLGSFGTNSAGVNGDTPIALNDAGQVAGNAVAYDSAHTRLSNVAFLYSNGALTTLGSFGADKNGRGVSAAAGLNDSGQVAGTSTVYDATGVSKGSAAFLWSKGTLTNLGNFGTDPTGFGSSTAKALNSSGQVVGSSTVYDATGVNKGSAAFLWSNGTLTNLGSFGTDNSGKGNSFAVGINNSGMVIGDSDRYVNGHYTATDAFLSANGVLTDLGNFGTDPTGHGSSIPVAVNAAGQVAGASDKYDANGVSLGRDAFLFTNGVLTDLGNFGIDSTGKSFSVATGLNSAGEVIGTSKVYDSAHNFLGTDSFLYDHGALTALSSLLTNPLGWTGLQATAINDSGEIVGFGIHNGQQEAFAVLPVPETSTMVSLGLLLALGLGRMAVAKRKKPPLPPILGESD
jgi:probable HAF family extracellular repeat protein